MEEGNVKFTRLTQPLNKYTFKAPEIKKWVEEHCKGKVVLNLFSGPTFIDGCTEIRNDLDNTMPALYHMDALDLVRLLAKEGEKFDRVVLDPPYSYRKSMELYKGNRNSRFKQILDEIPKILKEDGRVITFGYHSSVMSRKRGFRIVEILLISHGGAIHDTIATVEERVTVSPFGLYCADCGVAIDYETSLYSDNPIRCKGCFEKWKKTVS